MIKLLYSNKSCFLFIIASPHTCVILVRGKSVVFNCIKLFCVMAEVLEMLHTKNCTL